jgi:hypothetical protein
MKFVRRVAVDVEVGGRAPVGAIGVSQLFRAYRVGGSAQGGTLGLVGDNDATHILLNAEGAETALELTNKNGRRQLPKP